MPEEYNYNIYDKELLAIIHYFEEWQPKLENTAMPIKVLTDHKCLKYFITTKKLTLRQARWTKFLSKFNFVVTYQNGKKNNKANALSKKLNERPANEKDNKQEHRMQVLLPLEHIEMQLIEITDQHKKITDNLEKVTHDLERVTDKLLILLDWVKDFNRKNVLLMEVRK